MDLFGQGQWAACILCVYFHTLSRRDASWAHCMCALSVSQALRAFLAAQ